MKKNILLSLVLLVSFTMNAQFAKEKSIDISAGYGLSVPYDNVDVFGEGFYLQGEYVMTLASWLDLRPYAGFIITSDKDDDGDNTPAFKSTANAFLIGGKARITAPIPWVAPYIEAGIGGSIGSFETVIANTNIDDSGFFFHIPFSVGLELGPKRNFDLAFTYYFHPSVEQFAGAAAVGVSIPLGK